jgi:hypothetical protein
MVTAGQGGTQAGRHIVKVNIDGEIVAECALIKRNRIVDGCLRSGIDTGVESRHDCQARPVRLSLNQSILLVHVQRNYPCGIQFNTSFFNDNRRRVLRARKEEKDYQNETTLNTSNRHPPIRRVCRPEINRKVGGGRIRGLYMR